MMAKTASLTSGLVAKKGQAMPAVVHQAAPEAKQAPSGIGICSDCRPFCWSSDTFIYYIYWIF